MKKDFTPYEQALALKELGFRDYCAAFYSAEEELCFKWESNGNMSLHLLRLIQAPTFSQAFRWFREKGYFYSIEICQEKHPLKSKYSFSLYGKNFYEEDYPNEYGWIDDFPMFKTYEEAELECLKKIIEICTK